MARTTSSRSKPSKLSQSEINRIKPVGVLTIETVRQKSERIITLNVKLPDGEVYRFHHRPVLFEQSQEFFEAEGESDTGRMITLLSEVLVKEDGTPFADLDDYNKVDVLIIRAIVRAIFSSARDEGGED